jgi:hypothetical protein
LFQQNTDILHYIGHIDEQGFTCSDGSLHASTLPEVGISAFILNGCQSYSQGRELIYGGADGGVVTLADVTNKTGIRFGTTVARLLSIGYPLNAAYQVSRDSIPSGYNYTLLGYGGVQVGQPQSGDPDICRIHEEGDEEYTVEFKSFLTSRWKLGGVTTYSLSGNDEYHLLGNTSPRITVEHDELQEYLDVHNKPIKDGKELYLNDATDEG